MNIKYKIKRFRSIIESQELELVSDKINILIGTNGSGKSNFLDAIRWFSAGDVKNIKSKKTKFHPNFNINDLYLDSPEIIYQAELDEDEKKVVLEHLHKINIKKFNDSKFYRYFIKYKDLYYKDLNINYKGLTDLAKIKEAIVLKFEDYWPSYIFVEKEIDRYNYFEINMPLEIAKEEIENSTKRGLNRDIKDMLCTALDSWIAIEEMFKYHPNILFSQNLENDNRILFEYPIQSVKNQETMNPTFKVLLNIIGKESIENLKQIIDLSTSEVKRAEIRILKDTLSMKFQKCFKEIFKNFSIDVLPEVLIDDNMFQILINGNEERYYGSSETYNQSSGFKAFFWLVIMLEATKKVDETTYGKALLIVDEPDKNLHILLQYELAKYLKLNFTNKNNIFILITSHSPFLIPNLNENIYISEIDKNGCTKITKAKEVNDIRNSGIFPLITLFYMDKLKDELFPKLDAKTKRIYYKDLNDSKKNDLLEQELKKIINNKFDYKIFKLSESESNNIFDISSNNFFSIHIYGINKLHELIINEHYKDKKDIFLTKSFIDGLFSKDILDSV
ncbi:AAA family ATPase [Spiroplasma platyhelix]|uniref:ATP-binding protein n=1 Tax=Spiroplasma platyhelix PALS-1 TaxID=1276218 RepID=A0A846TX75_9MOLU|nr:AAA family ATPase [Spiroplasma platyhelix]MBE4704433.1 hypothetical protein [Spiroplasma platyhelix PALS-1]NKE38802.1 ATP-binding protein [Spiroplasma platyhelix PALS-1]UJB29015.1 hypothetical protein SPLAT_v1c02510 [Spiroplasma platyhelix PALS-1]